MLDLKKLQYIDSLRGFAILMVLFNHTCESIENLPSIIKIIGNYGKYGVQLFFVMSAYTLCLSMHDRKEKNFLLNYFIRRFFRIAPLYYFGILIYFSAFFLYEHFNFNTFLPNPNYTAKTLITNISFSHGLFSDTFSGIVLGGWSIGTEMAFYLIFPVIFAFFSKIKKTHMLILIPALATIVFTLFFRALPHIFPPLSSHDFEFYYCSIMNQLPVFLVGISLFFFTLHNPVNKIILKYSPLLFLGLTIVMLLCKRFGYINDITLYPFFVSISFIFLFFTTKNVSKINSKIIQKIGQLSYSIYICHFVFAWGLSSYLNIWLKGSLNPSIILFIAFSCSLGFSFLFSLLTQFLIETHGIELGKKLILKFDKK